MIVMGIETSCDETSVALLRNGREVLANVISSQIDIHKKYGGVVPEVASRKHLENMNHIIKAALLEANLKFQDIDLIAVTKGPGLVGALLVGVSAAKALAYGLDIPLIGVNHMEGHICANYISHKDLKPPFISLVVSGGHSYLIHVKEYTEYELIGTTRDDAAGESFDKVARSLGLGYPGGPLIDALAKKGNPKAFDFPRVMLEENSYDFSFSGLKTAVLNTLNGLRQKNLNICVEDVVASFQEAVLDVLVEKSFRLLKEREQKILVISGGVSANDGLRKRMEERGAKEDVRIYYPEKILSTDNAAMIASAGYFRYKKGECSELSMQVTSNLGF